MFDFTEPTINAIYGWSNVLVIVGLVTGLIGGAGAIWAGGQRDRFAAVKEADMEEKLAAANANAAKANEGLAKANLDIEDRKNENLKLHAQVASLETEAANAKTAQMQMEKSLEETRAKTSESIEHSTKAIKLAMDEAWDRTLREGDFAPRTLDFTKKPEYRERLREFAGTKFLVVTLPENEPWRTGVMIDELLESSGWVREKPLETRPESKDFPFSDLVFIETLVAPSGSFNEASPLRKAMWTLERILSHSEIQAGSINDIIGRPRDVPEGVVRIVVGPKPQIHAEITKKNREFDRDLPRRIQEHEEAIKKAMKEGTLPSTPDNTPRGKQSE